MMLCSLNKEPPWDLLYPPVLADIYMEEFEQATIEVVDHKPQVWLCFVNNTSIIWQHEPKLSLEHLSGLHSSWRLHDPLGIYSFLLLKRELLNSDKLVP